MIHFRLGKKANSLQEMVPGTGISFLTNFVILIHSKKVHPDLNINLKNRF